MFESIVAASSVLCWVVLMVFRSKRHPVSLAFLGRQSWAWVAAINADFFFAQGCAQGVAQGFPARKDLLKGCSRGAQGVLKALLKVALSKFAGTLSGP